MILRLSSKLAKKIGEGKLPSRVLDTNPFADWSAHLFTADRTGYVIVINTTTLYSAVFFARGITDDNALILRATSNIRELMQDNDMEFQYLSFIVPAIGSIVFCSALNRSVTGSMNDLIRLAKFHLLKGEISPYDTAAKINEAPMSMLEMTSPREAMKRLKLETNQS